MNAVAAIELQDVDFHFGEVAIFRNVNLTIAQGEYLGIIGPNGSGKSTLLKLILGLLTPARGRIRIFGTDVRDRSARLAVGYVPQRIAQTDETFPATVAEVVASGRTPHMGIGRWFSAHDRQAVERAMHITGITDLRQRRLSELSGGQRQRAFIARALAAEPRILILDEPTVGVDAQSQRSFFAFLQELNEEHGITIIFVSHDTHALMKAVTCVLCLQEGELCHCTPNELLRDDHLRRHLLPETEALPHQHHPGCAHDHGTQSHPRDQVPAPQSTRKKRPTKRQP